MNEQRYVPRTFSFNSASLTGLFVFGVGKGGSGALLFDMMVGGRLAEVGGV